MERYKDIMDIKNKLDKTGIFSDEESLKIAMTKSFEKSNKIVKNSDNTNVTFKLNEKYLDSDKDDYITASLRLVRKTKKRLDKFAEKNGQYKKILLVSQLLDEAMNKYE